MSGAAIHPELRRAARVLPRGLGRPSVVKASRAIERLLDRRDAPDFGEQVDFGSGSVRVHLPPIQTPGPGPALLWIHGGGFVVGHPAQEDRICGFYAAELGILVAAVRYRLAPEHPFPAALHDCHDALEYLAGRPDVDASKIVIGGASAGGGLAAQLAVLARDRGVVAPAMQLLVYPMLDDRTTLRTDLDESGFRLWNNKSNAFGWSSYLGQEPGGDNVPATAAPARLDNLAGLPPAWIGVGELDLFHDEDWAYGHRLAAAGVPTELVVVEGAYHAFDAVAWHSDVSAQFQFSQTAAMREVIGDTFVVS